VATLLNTPHKPHSTKATNENPNQVDMASSSLALAKFFL
jgi:hypothetical protein